MKLLFENWRQYLNEEQLLIEGRIEDIKKKYPDLDEKGLLDILIDKDPSGNQKYLAWAAKQLAQRDDPGSQTANYAAANIELYHKLRAHIPSEYKDINRIKDLRDLERIASDTYQRKAEKDRLKAIEAKYKQEAKENSDVIYKDENFLVVRPFNEGASCFWGRGTKWCISATDTRNYYNQYTGEGKAFYFLFMKNRGNFSTTEYRKLHKLALVYDGSTQEFDEAYDATDEVMDMSEVIKVMASNLFGERFTEAYEEAEDYGFVLEGQFEEDYPEYYETIVSVLRKQGMEPDDDLEEFWANAVENEWYEIDSYAVGHFLDNPAGARQEDYDRIYEEADLQNVYVSYDEYEPGRWYYDGGLSFDFGSYEFGPPGDPLELDDYDLEDEVREVLDDYSVYPREIEIYGNDIRIDIDTEEDYYTTDPMQRFANFVNEMSEIDEKYGNIEKSLIDLFIDQGVLDISDEPVGQLQAKLKEKDLKNFDITSEGRAMKSSSNPLEYTEVGINAGVQQIVGVMGGQSGISSPATSKIIYFFKQNFQSDEGRSYADNVLFDKMDTLLDQAYRDAEKQLSIPGLEAPERKRLVPPLAVGLSPFVYASSQEDKIALRLHIKADAELGEEQAGYIVEFIDFFDENFDSLKTIVGEVVDKLLKEAIVKALESVKEDFPDLTRALGVNESKKKKRDKNTFGEQTMKLIMEGFRQYLEELDFDFSTFELKKELNPKVWEGEKLRPEVAQKLREIVDDFWSDLDLKDVGIVDIIITGSAANYNWSEKSDIDLHILVNFNDIEAPMDLVKDYFRSVRANWNKVHNVKIGTHEVELYVQDTGEPHMSTGVYSLLYNEWETKPTYREVTIDEPLVGKKAQAFMDLIEDVEAVFAAGRHEEAHEEAIRLRDRIRDFRKCGLEQGGEFSPENLAFKVLRRNGYLGRLSDVRTDAYDRMMSLNGGQPSGITIRIDEKKNPRIPRKKGQPAKSKKHSDLYTDEDPKGTIHGLKFATESDAKASVTKIRKSGRSHAHKVQAAVAMEQRAKAAGKASAAAVYRKYINSVKKDK